MKKLFIIAAAACVTLASCVKNEPVATVEQGDEIAFTAPVVAPSTKATANNGDIVFPHTEFFLYAYYGDESAPYAGTSESLYINNKEFVEKTGYWGGYAPQYWPKSGDLTFCAYAPKNANLTSSCTAAALTLNYTATATADVDVLYSDWVKDKTNQSDTYATQNKQGDTGIDLPFHHALSKVVFKVKAGSDDAASLIKIKGITFGGVLPKGTLTVSHDTGAEWGSAEGAALNCTVIANEDGNSNATAITTSGAVIGDSFMFVPQTVSTTDNMVVNYYMSTDGDWIEQSTTLSLNDTWAMKTCYTYTIVVTLDEIKMAPVLAEDWVASEPEEKEIEGIF